MLKIEKLKTLKTLIGSNELILTGSLALAYHGLLTIEEGNDLDLIVIDPSPSTTEVLKRLQSEKPSPKFKEGGPVAYSFYFESIKVDVWVLSNHEDKEYLTTEYGVRVASIRSVVNAKMSYGRSKDWIQLMQLSNKIFDKQKFDAALPTLSKHSEDYNA